MRFIILEEMSFREKIMLNSIINIIAPILKEVIINCMPSKLEYLAPIVKIIPTRLVYGLVSSSIIFVMNTLSRATGVLIYKELPKLAKEEEVLSITNGEVVNNIPQEAIMENILGDSLRNMENMVALEQLSQSVASLAEVSPSVSTTIETGISCTSGFLALISSLV